MFDARTTLHGEAMVVVVPFSRHLWVVGLVRFQLLKSSVDGDELSRIIMEIQHRKIKVLAGNSLR